MDKTKNYIKAVLIVLIFISLIAILLIVLKISKNDENKTKNNDVQIDTQEERNDVQANMVKKEISKYYSEDEYGNALNIEDSISKFNIYISDVPKDIQRYIKDKNEYIKQIKIYMYFNGLVDATRVEYVTSKFSEELNKIGVKFKLNDVGNTILKVILDLSTQEIEITEE